MIADAHRGKFDFIITKEISRFSRNTLDSIMYTQELLDAGVGVLFQNDNINTLDSDSEFRLVVMAGVAQDEVRKLSERLKFGFRQSIKNGRVLGNDRLWGYDKKDCRLSIVPEEAEIVRLIFELYASGNYGLRRLSHELTVRGYTSSRGNDFSTSTIANIIQNPKYKGWYCGNKTRSLDYRKKKTAVLSEEEWVMYPDPNVPAIVSEELWDRANTLFKQRSARTKNRGYGSSTKYPYSGKIICEEHETLYHRQAYTTGSGLTEYWICKKYREAGKTGCVLPTIRTSELDMVLSVFFDRIIKNKSEVVDMAAKAILSAEESMGPDLQIEKLTCRIKSAEIKKDKLLELSIEGAITIEEFKKRNELCNEQIAELRNQLDEQRALVETMQKLDTESIRQALWEELDFKSGISSEVVSQILDHAVVLKTSGKDRIELELFFRLGEAVTVGYYRRPFAFCDGSLRNTIPMTPIRRT